MAYARGMKSAPLHGKLVLALALLLPVYFAVAALGTRFGLWHWRTGLGFLTITAGPIILGLVAILALISLVLIVRRKPRTGWWPALLALAIPLAIFAALTVIRSQAGEIPPIHDVATDTADPPQFSAARLADRVAADANPLNDYATPVGQLEPWRDAEQDLATRSHAEIIETSYPDLEPVPLQSADRAQALAAISDAMTEMGFADIAVDAEAGRVEGVAQTFWFGFKDDVVARVGEDRIDFRSVSRVGLSDLGANAARIEELRRQVARRIAP